MVAHYRLRSWFKPEWLDGPLLSMNINAIDYLSANPEMIDWKNLSANPNAMTLLEANQDKIDWVMLSRNTSAIHLLEANQDKIHWANLSSNRNAVPLLEANQDKIDWEQIMSNSNAMHLIEPYIGWCANTSSVTRPHTLLYSYTKLALNENAIHIIQWCIDNIIRSRSPSDDAHNKEFWIKISMHPNAIDIIKTRVGWNQQTKTIAYPDKLNWGCVSVNPNVAQLQDLFASIVGGNQYLSNTLANSVLVVYTFVEPLIQHELPTRAADIELYLDDPNSDSEHESDYEDDSDDEIHHEFDHDRMLQNGYIETMCARVMSSHLEIFELWEPRPWLQREITEYLYSPKRIEASLQSGLTMDQIMDGLA
jgi:hypothetical protein